MPEQSLANHFLLPLPNQTGTYFEDTLTFLVHHGEEGAMGLVVNRPTPIKLSEILKEAELNAEPGETVMLLEGGPVSPSRPSILHTTDFMTDSSIDVEGCVGYTTEMSTGDIYTTLKAISEGTGPESYLFLLGYAGWSPGQLEREIEDNAWVICPSSTKVLFEEEYEARLSSVSESLGVDFSKLSPQGGLA